MPGRFRPGSKRPECRGAALARHMVVVSAKADAATSLGLPATNQFSLWDWVGGRFSVWSAIGLPAMLSIGPERFDEFLAGGHAMDRHSIDAPLEANLPATLALLALWNALVLQTSSLCLLPYDDRLRGMVTWLQQLEMESLGKSRSLNGDVVAMPTSPVIWGGVGTDAQHTFFQALRQGTLRTAIDIVVIDRAQHAYPEHHRALVANARAQAEALVAADPDSRSLNAVSVLQLDALTPATLGSLLALYEHKTTMLATLLGINAFDQPGVELGKIARTAARRPMNHTPAVLATGGAGYIGSHTMVELLAAGFDVICLDNFSNSSPEAVKRVEKITHKRVTLVNGDVRDREVLARVFHRPIDAVVHFAALKAVGESVQRPVEYYDNNIGGTLALLEAMDAKGVNRIVFSSSATVYGVPDSLPLTEDAPIRPVNPYGHTKAMVEQILRDWCAADAARSAVSLRYFNPIGAHPSGTIGEDPQDIPNNLFPFIAQVAIGKRDKLNVWGGDWPTPDGTGVRDYLHVVDLALGHVAGIAYAQSHAGFTPINLGTGRGTSVLEMVQAFERASGRTVPHVLAARREGDVAACWADVALARRLLGWEATRTIEQACADGWRWQSGNPNGYRH